MSLRKSVLPGCGEDAQQESYDFVCFPQPLEAGNFLFQCHMVVDVHGGRDAGVAHDLLDHLQVGLVFAESSAEGMPQGMRRKMGQQLRLPLLLLGCFRLLVIVCDPDPFDGAVDCVRAQCSACLAGEDEVGVPVYDNINRPASL